MGVLHDEARKRGAGVLFLGGWRCKWLAATILGAEYKRHRKENTQDGSGYVCKRVCMEVLRKVHDEARQRGAGVLFLGEKLAANCSAAAYFAACVAAARFGRLLSFRGRRGRCGGLCEGSCGWQLFGLTGQDFTAWQLTVCEGDKRRFLCVWGGANWGPCCSRSTLWQLLTQRQLNLRQTVVCGSSRRVQEGRSAARLRGGAVVARCASLAAHQGRNL